MSNRAVNLLKIKKEYSNLDLVKINAIFDKIPSVLEEIEQKPFSDVSQELGCDSVLLKIDEKMQDTIITPFWAISRSVSGRWACNKPNINQTFVAVSNINPRNNKLQKPSLRILTLKLDPEREKQ